MNTSNIPFFYWEKKILRWETLRYSKFLFFYPLSWTVRNRLRSSIEIIVSRAQKDWTVLELGCGSGILAIKILNKIKCYQGIDISPSAITFAQKKIPHQNAYFVADDILRVSFPQKNLVIFLGLVDWLNRQQIDELFSKIQTEHMFFSFTNKNDVSSLSPYFYYRKIMDLKIKKNNSYHAQNYSEEDICNLLRKHNYSFEILKKPSFLNPGVLIWATK